MIDAAGGALPVDPLSLFAAVGQERQGHELDRWLPDAANQPLWPGEERLRSLAARLATGPLQPPAGAWKIVAVRSVIMGPEQFNRRLSSLNSKAKVHFTAFRELLELAWKMADDGLPTWVQSDKHGGRHYYMEPLNEAFPRVWIDRGPEGPDLSRYTLRCPGKSLRLSLCPRADSSDGLVCACVDGEQDPPRGLDGRVQRLLDLASA